MNGAPSSRRGPVGRRALLRLAGIAGLAAALASCGRRPSTLEPPAGADPTRFPRPYPNPAQDRQSGPRSLIP